MQITMYNGVGLSTVRGSGTSGHVQRNFAAIPKRGQEYTGEMNVEPIIRQANPDILEHNRKRKIEVECVELSDKLEDQGYTQKQIDKEVNAYRQKKLQEYETSCSYDELNDSKIKDSHQSAVIQLRRNAKLEDAMGLLTSQTTPDASKIDE